MSLKVSSVFFAAVLVASFIVQPAATQTSQANNGTLPVNYPAKIIPESNTICPSTEEREMTFAKIDQEINALIRNTVLPNSCPGIYPQNPAPSCLEIAECDPSLPSGYYWINSTTQVYCDMDREGCNSTGGWTRIVYLNMTDPTHQCPSAWTEITSPIRTCGKSSGSSCDSAVFNTNGIEYTHVLGRAIGFEFGSPDEFKTLGDIDTPYVDGMSITHGMPREHVWTFVASCHSRCPCSNDPASRSAPSFVGEDYFCEEGVGQNLGDIPFHTVDDPLWDGQGCDTDACCTYNNPPWFCTQLAQATTDDIEIRLCGDESLENEDIPIELIEIYIQ